MCEFTCNLHSFLIFNCYKAQKMAACKIYVLFSPAPSTDNLSSFVIWDISLTLLGYIRRAMRKRKLFTCKVPKKTPCLFGMGQLDYGTNTKHSKIMLPVFLLTFGKGDFFLPEVKAPGAFNVYDLRNMNS